MKKLATFVAAMLLSPCIMAAVPNWMIPSPISIAITVGQWIQRDRVEVFYVQARARGVNEQDARDQAFRLAVEMAVGSLVTSETQVKDGEVLRHEIVNYSSGYVHDFKILQQRTSRDGVEIVVDVWVRKSTIADRLLNVSQGSDAVPGARIAEQYRSLMQERATGDRLLEQVLRDYPSRAYDINVVTTETRTTVDRNLVFVINAGLRLNHGYLRSLQEAVDATASNRNASQCARSYCGNGHYVRIKYRPDDGFFTQGTDAWFDDSVRSTLMYRHLSDSNPHILVHLHDGFGTTVFRACYEHDHLTITNYSPGRRFVHWDQARTLIDGQLSTKPVLQIRLSAAEITKVRKVDVSIVSQAQCRTN